MPYEGNSMQARAPPTVCEVYGARPLCRSTASRGRRSPASAGSVSEEILQFCEDRAVGALDVRREEEPIVDPVPVRVALDLVGLLIPVVVLDIEHRPRVDPVGEQEAEVERSKTRSSLFRTSTNVSCRS